MQCWVFWKWFRERLFIHGSGFLYVKGLWLTCQARTTKPPRSFPWKITVEEFRAKKMQALGTIPSLLWDNPLYIFLKQFFFFLIEAQFSSDQFSRSVVSDSLRPHESQHARPPCPSPNPGAYSNSCPSSRWCHPAISSSVVPFSSCPQSLPASGSFPMNQLFAWGGQSIGVSASASVLPMTEG